MPLPVDDPRRIAAPLPERPTPPELGSPVWVGRCRVELREHTAGPHRFYVYEAATGRPVSMATATPEGWQGLCHYLEWFPADGHRLGERYRRADAPPKLRNKPPGETLPDYSRGKKPMPSPPIPVSDAALCQYCPASIRWLRTKCDKKMPVDAIPETRITTDGRLVKLWVPHFASCPGASRSRARAAAAPDGAEPLLGSSTAPEPSPEPDPQLGLGIA